MEIDADERDSYLYRFLEVSVSSINNAVSFACTDSLD
jgi:hypothetical protein